MGYTYRSAYFHQAKKKVENAARKKEKEQENVRAWLNLDPEDLPDHDWGDDQPPDTSTLDGEPEGGLFSSDEGQVTLAELFDSMEQESAYGNLEMEDAEDSDVSCLFTAGGEEEDVPMELDDADIPSLVPGLPPPNNTALSLDEICTYQLITLLDKAGAPRNCYGRLVALLKKHSKKGFTVENLISRDVFLRRMQERFNCPTLLTSCVSDCTVFRFPFTEMLHIGEVKKGYSRGNLTSACEAVSIYFKLVCS
jgi:hypothetical protein